ncbi:outer membrane beta-barrel protein [Ruegeria sp. R14_0]|uniref:outer membrane protein n=1 Tax=Ruegeria sp. R14_0 TaxID=2821100 RepID=UPI001ADB87FB|nr:outer membrane beta-barrel protein [Ruegeria sp. R14_0]MBO9444250.1 porin family protein [Ruegeria sp. R14_0]
MERVRVKTLERVSGLLLKSALSVVVAFAVLPGTTVAGNLDQGLSDPPVVDPKRFGSDVSAFYLGTTGLYAIGGNERFGLNTPNGTSEVGELDLSGTLGGLRAGWRGVLPAKGGRDYVYGFEVGYEFGSLDDTATGQVDGNAVSGGSKVSNVFSIRLRNGLTNRSGTVLYYVSAGYVNGDIETTSQQATRSAIQSFEDSGRRSGFSASIGAEHNLTEHWSITGEYEYVQFSAEDVRFDNGTSTRSTPKYHGLKIGLNYRF